MSNTFTDASGVVRLSGSWGELIVTDSALIEPATVGDTALTIIAPDGAAANGDTELSVIGDTGGLFQIGSAGDIGADLDTEFASAHRLNVDGETVLQAGATGTTVGAPTGSTSGLILKSHPAGQPLFQALDDKLAFFGGPPVVVPAGVAVSAAGIHAALVSLGLILP